MHHLVKCRRFFRLNLAGLTDHENYHFIQNAHRTIEIALEHGETIKGNVHEIGRDYLVIKRENKCLQTILKDRIVKVIVEIDRME